MRNKKLGQIIIPAKIIVQPHELMVATILSWTGHAVTFLPTSQTRTADIFYRGREWEIKSPKGKSSRTIENNMRLAFKQSPNIIIDLSRIKICETQAIREVKRQYTLIRQIKKVLILTKSHKIIEL